MAKKKFKDVIRTSDVPVLVDFYADWCGPCQTMSPLVQQIADELEGKIKVIKINIDKNQQASLHFGVRSIPHFILFKRGKILWRKGGLMTKRDLEKYLKGFL
ncbi:thioredoxin [Echinicola pacifica]|uniref:Thioredoxin n=1 Tax=Echinicola pacifica TaxID=346377 RepID=A0A918PW60_9BACT|nr:thioredoxin [Echinicola pacifica]GGZ22956.1 thioredoxin [Echinicola pacifica]